MIKTPQRNNGITTGEPTHGINPNELFFCSYNATNSENRLTRVDNPETDIIWDSCSKNKFKEHGIDQNNNQSTNLTRHKNCK